MLCWRKELKPPCPPPPKYKGVQLEAVMGQLPFPRRQMGLAARRGAGEQQLCLLMCLQILTS